MYQVFLAGVPLPIAPSKIETKVGSRNKVIDLVDGSQVSIPKGAELTEVNFSFLLPSQQYPFATIGGEIAGNLGIIGNLTTSAFLTYLDMLKMNRETFQFIVVRLGMGLKLTSLYNTNLKCTLEDYSIIEDAENGFDVEVQVSLREYRPYTSLVYDVINKTIGAIRP